MSFCLFRKVRRLRFSMVDIWEMTGALEIQDGGSQTGNNYISACRLDSVEISTAKPMFSRSLNSTALLAIRHNVT